MALLNICHRCKAAVNADYDAVYYKAYICPRCRKPFTDTYAIDSKEWDKWSEEKRKEYIHASINGTKKEFFEKYPVVVSNEDKKNTAKLRVFLFAFLVLCLVVAVVCWKELPVLSIFCVAIVIFVICILVSAKKDMGINYEMNEIIRYDADDCTLHLLKRDSRIANYVKIKDSNNIHIKYEPEKLHIGAVSVGGVTTGGAYTTGGYNYVAGTSKSGFAKLEYKDKSVFYIQLSDALYEQAKNSSVKEYLEPSTKRILAIGTEPLTEAELQQMITNYKTTGFGGNFDKTKATFAQCRQIVAWMCGDE